ncbi:hypothetical protein [Microbulbifer sp. TYP-18]|uniref:hypothetical protein n=1 Tax=Microbulbifer sp. TYP-18 TaxID=3230024 RepID=UPI0034C60B47
MSFSVREDGDLEVECSEEELEALLESGDEEAIAAVLYGDSKEAPKTNEPEKEPDDKQPEPEAPEPQANTNADDQGDTDGDSLDADQQEVEGADKVVVGRDGKSRIPYSVLDNTRKKLTEERKTFQEERAQWEQEKVELQKAQRLNEELRKQLKANDLQPAALPEDVEITEEELKGLDEYGEVGDLVRKMALQNRYLKAQLTGNGTSPAPVEPEGGSAQQEVDEALAANQSLTEWSQSDPDRWEFAVSVDEKLKSDPAFKDKSFAERFAEAERRTKVAFGDPLDPSPDGKAGDKPDLATKVKEKIREAEQTEHPKSLTDLGRPPAGEKSLAERVEAMSEEEMLEFVSKRDPDEIFNLLEG